MANQLIADDGSVSGLSGLRYACDASGALQIFTGAGVLALTIDANQLLTFAKPPAGVFPSGTAMIFAQTSAPTGWTKSTTHNDKALRVVSGTAGSGGTVAFSTAFTNQGVSGTVGSTTSTGTVGVSGTVGSTTLAESQIPSHRHFTGNNSESATWARYGLNGASWVGIRNANASGSGYDTNTSYTGGSGSHNHSFSGSGSFTGDAHSHSFSGNAINLAVQYVDTIIATKD